MAACLTECTESLKLDKKSASSFDWNISTPNRRASLGTCSTTLCLMRQWLSMIKFWMVCNKECTRPSTDSTSQMRPACETMFRRTSWNSSFIKSEIKLSSWRCVTSRPSTLATGPKTWAKAARTGCAESRPRDWNCGRMYCCSCSGDRGVTRRRQGSMTRTASLRTSCSLSFMSWMKDCSRLVAMISGPKAAQSWSKFFATVRRTLQERSSAASLMTESVCCLFSSRLSMFAITSVVCTQATRMVSWVSSWDSCLYTWIRSLKISAFSHTEMRSRILCAAARRTMGVSSAHSVVYALRRPAFWSSLAKRYAVGSSAQAETRAVKKSDFVAKRCKVGTRYSGARFGLLSTTLHKELIAWSRITVSSCAAKCSNGAIRSSSCPLM
mmetsp:Transcript_26358/g.87357  ORF Transcript_26358/g.87357 Transcript_26358/m.87357 type:complete len:383 (+) Transcript_26358:750-1898(+)